MPNRLSGALLISAALHALLLAALAGGHRQGTLPSSRAFAPITLSVVPVSAVLAEPAAPLAAVISEPPQPVAPVARARRAAAVATATPPIRQAPRVDPPPIAERAGVAEAGDIESIEQYRLALIFATRRDPARDHGLMPVTTESLRAEVRLRFASDGALLDASVHRPSGSPELDQRAVEMLRRARAAVPPPAVLLRREFALDITVLLAP